MGMDIVLYGETYNKAMSGIEKMLFDESDPMTAFKKDTYPEAFQTYIRRHIETIEAIDMIYREEEDKAAWIDKLADRLVESAKAELDAIPRKSKRNDQQISYNMLLAVYLFPALIDKKYESCEMLSDSIVEKWNRTFKTSVGKANFEQIEGGFHRKFCYITTAVCESKGKPDDCYELELLRSYRDSYLMSTEEGAELVNEYYDIAPTIVSRINRRADSDKIYEDIWDSYLSGCVSYIEAGDNEACRALYMEMVYELKSRYMA